MGYIQCTLLGKVNYMQVCYFPGCTLKNKAKQLDIAARLSAQALGIDLVEIPDWQCCGGVFTSAKDEIATKLSSVRALEYAKETGMPLVTVCSACHNVIKQTNFAMKEDEDFALRVNNYSQFDMPYCGETEVLHYLELLRDKIGFETVREKVKSPLTGKRIAAYYGCLLLRPNSVMRMDDPENPKILENLIRALGAEPVIYSRRNECCGGYTVMENGVQAKKLSSEIMREVELCGADEVVTACPLCRYNLMKNSGSNIPVRYFTELLAEALDVQEGQDGD